MTTLTSDVVTVKIAGIANEIEAKIDTGAGQSSLHAENITEKGDSVIFQIGERIYRAPLETSQDISSADGGTSARPVIKASLEIEGQTIEALVNLNDRSEMPQKLLIGQDVIRAGNFTLKFTEEGTSEPSDENEEQKVPGDSQSMETPPEPVLAPTAHDDGLAEEVFALIDQLVEISEHLSAAETSLNALRVRALKMLKGVGFKKPNAPISTPTSAPTQEPSVQSKPDTVYKPYEQDKPFNA